MKDKLVLIKTKTIDKGSADCDGCIIQFAERCGTTSDSSILCEKGYCYKLVVEPQKIQTEYEWKKERLELLKSQDTTTQCIYIHEINILEKWLKDNRPGDWQQCTMENTNTGETIKRKTSNETRVLEKICIDERYLLYAKNIDSSFVVSDLEDYEINLAEKSDCLPAAD